MDPELILVQSTQCRKEVIFGELCLWVDLPVNYQFKGRTFLRLHSVGGLSEELYVIASFAQAVPCGSKFRRIVGLTKSLPGPWTTVDGNFINSVVTVQLGRVNEKGYTEFPKKPFTLLFELGDGGPTGDSGV